MVTATLKSQCDGSGLVPVPGLDGELDASACGGCIRCRDLSSAARRAFAATDYDDGAF